MPMSGVARPTQSGPVSELPAETIADLEAIYGAGSWLSCRRTPKGKSNVSFLIDTASGRHVLRRSEPRKTVTALQFEIALIDYLRAHGFPAPEIVHTRRGEAYAAHDGSLYLLSVFIEGEHYDQRRPAQLREAARGLGRYHRIVATFPEARDWRQAAPLPDLADRGAHLLDELAELGRDFLPGDERAAFEANRVELRDTLPRVHERFAAVYPTLPRLVVHGSYGQSAMLFNGDVLAGVLDYDRATLDARGLDLAYTIKTSCRDRLERRRRGVWAGYNLDTCRAFMNGYRQEASITDEEAHTLPLVTACQRLAKVVHKSHNFLSKHATVPQEMKDMQKVAAIFERETLHVRWLEKHGDEFAAALTSA